MGATTIYSTDNRGETKEYVLSTGQAVSGYTYAKPSTGSVSNTNACNFFFNNYLWVCGKSSKFFQYNTGAGGNDNDAPQPTPTPTSTTSYTMPPKTSSTTTTVQPTVTDKPAYIACKGCTACTIGDTSTLQSCDKKGSGGKRWCEPNRIVLHATPTFTGAAVVKITDFPMIEVASPPKHPVASSKDSCKNAHKGTPNDNAEWINCEKGDGKTVSVGWKYMGGDDFENGKCKGDYFAVLPWTMRSVAYPVTGGTLNCGRTQACLRIKNGGNEKAKWKIAGFIDRHRNTQNLMLSPRAYDQAYSQGYTGGSVVWEVIECDRQYCQSFTSCQQSGSPIEQDCIVKN